MRRALLAPIVLVLAAITGPMDAQATHYNVTITWPLNGAGITQTCHPGVSGWFEPVFGWQRSCDEAYDIGNAGNDKNVFIRGNGWAQSTTTAKSQDTLYFNQTCTAPAAGTQYANVWEVYLPEGTVATAFHHMSNHHYNPGQQVPNGTNVGDQWNLGFPVYYCSGVPAMDGPHIHMEAARAGSFTDLWESSWVRFTHTGCPCFLESAPANGELDHE